MRGIPKERLHSEKFVGIGFRTGVRLPSPPPRRRKLHIACGDFFTKVTGALIPLRLLFRKKVALHLRCSLACALQGIDALRLATNLFRGCESSNPTAEGTKISVSCASHKANKSEPCAGWRRVRICCFSEKYRDIEIEQRRYAGYRISWII